MVKNEKVTSVDAAELQAYRYEFSTVELIYRMSRRQNKPLWIQSYNG